VSYLFSEGQVTNHARASSRPRSTPLVSLHAQQGRSSVQHPEKEPQNWPSYSELFNQRFSPLTQITPANAKNLELQWVWQSKSLEKFEATALVVDGVLYTLQGPPAQGVYEIIALDAVSGRPFWTLEYRPMLEARPCCGRVSRGLAILGDTLYMGTIYANLVAIDAKTGKILWDHTVEKVGEAREIAITHAPVIIKAIVSASPRDLARGFICAFDAKTGKDSGA
jgi:alcohol dehydrogenase (cytochrome c)